MLSARIPHNWPESTTVNADPNFTDPATLRLAVFLGALGGMLLWEWRYPFRAALEPKFSRLLRHLSLMTLNFLILRLVSGGGAYAVAILAAQKGWGLFALWPMPGWAVVLAGLLLLDFAIYAQHVLFHKIPWFWRLHRVHHSDPTFDTTTAIRFHPLEIVLSMFYKMLLVVIFGITPVTVLAFEMLLNACAQFNHGNVRLPAGAERILRWLLITPDLHRIHHSAERRETDSNFGFSVPWWDRWCGTYRTEPRRGQPSIVIGLPDIPDPSRLNLIALLRLPFG